MLFGIVLEMEVTDMLELIVLGVMFGVVCGVLFWIEYDQAKRRQSKENGYRSLPEISSGTPMPSVKPPKEECGNCSKCKCERPSTNTGPR